MCLLRYVFNNTSVATKEDWELDFRACDIHYVNRNKILIHFL